MTKLPFAIVALALAACGTDTRDLPPEPEDGCPPVPTCLDWHPPLEAGGAYLDDAQMAQQCLRGAMLIGASMHSADLRGADLTGADLRGADLTWADLSCAILDGALLDDVRLNGATRPEDDIPGWYVNDAGHLPPRPLTGQRVGAVGGEEGADLEPLAAAQRAAVGPGDGEALRVGADDELGLTVVVGAA